MGISRAMSLHNPPPRYSLRVAKRADAATLTDFIISALPSLTASSSHQAILSEVTRLICDPFSAYLIVCIGPRDNTIIACTQCSMSPAEFARNPGVGRRAHCTLIADLASVNWPGIIADLLGHTTRYAAQTYNASELELRAPTHQTVTEAVEQLNSSRSVRCVRASSMIGRGAHFVDSAPDMQLSVSYCLTVPARL
ncbi:hypothetical protein EXIGLDRAFT_724606 [Exidia glandulosa HHB12029]|uniref:N-acetyltransferase domain-containing protein n=1 Tax=Exidia glandulosa HHB12029 TaxID=1314781 RepID=A0A165MPV4_EXIGL|nr:hypothetical protein EXIGLDRAFT_724606 [Exidia glandulosa HHB12029]